MLRPLLRLLLMLPLRLMPAMDTTMERGLLMLSLRLLLLLMLPLRLRLTPGTDTMAMASTGLMAMDTMESGLTAMDTTMERGLLMLSLRLLLLLMPMLPLRLMPGTDTTDMPTGLMAMADTTDTGPMAIMAMAGERNKKHIFYQTAAN